MLQINSKHFALLSAFLFCIGTSSADESDLGGTIEAITTDGRTFQLPLVNSQVTAVIDGDIASVHIKQIFENPSTDAVYATYLFPLNEDAAIHAMSMTVGQDTIKAQIKKKNAARETYEAAKSAGKSAALLTQHRPNMFTQEVANLMPEQPVTIELTYAQIIPFRDNAYELVVPTVVGPRYMPREPKLGGEPMLVSFDAEREAEHESNGAWVLGPPPAYPDVHGLTIPKAIDPDRFEFRAVIRGGVEVAHVHSDTHSIDSRPGADPVREREISLTEKRTIPNRDLILRYELGGQDIQAGVLTHVDQRGGFFSLLITPPELPVMSEIAPREIVFVMDTSGSMNGLPLDASKAFMHAALQALRPGDAFRVVQFSSTASEFANAAVLATPQNVRAGRTYVDHLRAGGGTEVIYALEQAFSVPPKRGRIRIVVFLTDGYIGNEIEVLRRQAQLMGDARVYAFGVGSSVNRYLLEEMARRGRGLVRYVDPTETSREAAEALARRIEMPVLTDIEIDWGDLQAKNVTPKPVPDLFAGEALRLTGRFDPKKIKETSVKLAVNGFAGGREATLPMVLNLNDSKTPSALAIIWARGRIGDLMTDLAAPDALRVSRLSDGGIEDEVTDLGLNYDLVTQWTSFVAVSERVINREATARDANVALHQPAGVPKTAYNPNMFGGSSAPEPSFWVMMILVAIGAGYVALRRREAGPARI